VSLALLDTDRVLVSLALLDTDSPSEFSLTGY
jgi:hypothetical protein